MKQKITLLVTTIMLATWLISCGTTVETGTLEFRANGEDFVRQGFVSKDGWQITFDNVLVTLANVAAYQTDPPYNAANGDDIVGEQVALSETFALDLAEGDPDAEPILVQAEDAAPAGHYNAISWQMVNAETGDAAGYTLVLIGTAVKDSQTIEFSMKFNETFQYRCGEYVGDVRKGILTADGMADVELTFHFDHVFGDADTPMDEALNVGALGFDPLAALATDGTLDVDSAALKAGLSSDKYAVLMDTLQTLGHVGEGHCYEAAGGFTGHGGE